MTVSLKKLKFCFSQLNKLTISQMPVQILQVQVNSKLINEIAEEKDLSPKKKPKKYGCKIKNVSIKIKHFFFFKYALSGI